MTTANRTIRNLYRDSVSLMQLSSRLAGVDGITKASAIMATPANLALLVEAGLVQGAVEAGPNDVLIALEGKNEPALAAAMDEALRALEAKPAAAGGARIAPPPRSLEAGLDTMPGANLALISTPGAFAAPEALKALRLGLHVMLFSDNVSGADEIMLKRLGRQHGLLVMGPDCGTAIIGGVPLGFANRVRRGRIGVVGASGTGLQQVTSLVDSLGEGVSDAIGTGGHDLSAEVGGITMKMGLAALAADDATEVIALVSKPPAEAVTREILNAAAKSGKPVVVCFLGADGKQIAGGNLHAAETLEDCAHMAVALARGRAPRRAPRAKPVRLPRPARGQKFVRGLYSGGTFCYEAALILGGRLDDVHANTPVGRARPLPDVWKSAGHTLLDLGDDLFTRGRPHPMIDHRLRNERILREASDAQTAVILLDIVLGTGSHADPAAAMVPAIEAARAKAKKAGRKLAFVGFICGTEADPQDLAKQRAALAGAGVLLAASNAAAVRLAAAIVGAP